MKNYLPLGLLWLAACSSPAAQNTEKQTTQKHDTVATESEVKTPVEEPTTSTPDPLAAVIDTTKNTIKGKIFLDKEELTVPPYGLEKIKALIEKIPYAEGDGDASMEALTTKTYNSLSVKEKFTYSMVHPESYAQICDPLPAHPDEANRIYGTIPDTYGELYWSSRQIDFFKNNRAELVPLIKEVITKEHSFKSNLKDAIVEMNGTNLIPFLIDYYNKDKKDHYILTVLLQLMKNNKYPEFVNSSGYKKLYREPKTEEDFMNAFYLDYNKANEELIIQRATNFYNGLQAK